MSLTARVKQFVKPDSSVGRAGHTIKNELRSRAERRSRTGVNLNVGSGHQEIPGFTSLDLDSEWYGRG